MHSFTSSSANMRSSLGGAFKRGSCSAVCSFRDLRSLSRSSATVFAFAWVLVYPSSAIATSTRSAFLICQIDSVGFIAFNRSFSAVSA